MSRWRRWGPTLQQLFILSNTLATLPDESAHRVCSAEWLVWQIMPRTGCSQRPVISKVDFMPTKDVCPPGRPRLGCAAACHRCASLRCAWNTAAPLQVTRRHGASRLHLEHHAACYQRVAAVQRAHAQELPARIAGMTSCPNLTRFCATVEETKRACVQQVTR